MTTRLVIGAGLIGAQLAAQLTERGDSVRVATRSGTEVAGARPIRLDASDADAITRAAEGAETIFVVTNPPYTSWPRDWPPVFRAAISAAERSGASLVVMGNLYPYGSPTGPMTEDTPELTNETKGLVRKAGWHDVREATLQGRIRGVEVRASDYFGPGSGGTAHLGSAFFSGILKSKTVRGVGGVDIDHSWSYIPDIASTLAAAADWTGDWGRVWHVPSGAPHPRAEIAAQLNALYGTTGEAAEIPRWVLRTAGLVSPMMREIHASSYQFAVPYVIDATETSERLGVEETPWHESLTVTAEWYRARL
ncbi:NAD-dependent epimerase/dehydratase family protein [Planctomonas sp. JC2975]|uniref:NAD-dependent epimerase/dehydratase family protein n=1 Tax=Planctomonas sp. JC2975 TaxID=2729626 RepID=UPI0014745634|nr:NAD-dependent epimerase/dehydratase family protein [Planctomonas sp. JC2975]NNC13233.1 NAD-dependent epimerase/dehydratase family protein [Planctomonas sp. JC2975]